MLLLVRLLDLYSWIVLAAVILSWIPSLQDNPIGRAISAMTEPVFKAVRRVLPPLGGLDLSPIVVLIGLRLLGRLLL